MRKQTMTTDPATETEQTQRWNVRLDPAGKAETYAIRHSGKIITFRRGRPWTVIGDRALAEKLGKIKEDVLSPETSPFVFQVAVAPEA
jgi:hypothetical protein